MSLIRRLGLLRWAGALSYLEAKLYWYLALILQSWIAISTIPLLFVTCEPLSFTLFIWSLCFNAMVIRPLPYILPGWSDIVLICGLSSQLWFHPKNTVWRWRSDGCLGPYAGNTTYIVNCNNWYIWLRRCWRGGGFRILESWGLRFNSLSSVPVRNQWSQVVSSELGLLVWCPWLIRWLVSPVSD